jgi:hypothetical protein
MKRVLASGVRLAAPLAITAILAAHPVGAQPASPQDFLRGLNGMLEDPSVREFQEREHRLEDLIQDSFRDRRIDRGQADHALDALRSIRDQENDLRSRHGGRLSPGDRDLINDRLAGLDREVDRMRAGGVPPRPEYAPPPEAYDFWRGAPESLHEREEFLEHRIRDGMEDRSLDRDEGRRAMEDLRSIREQEEHSQREDRGYLSDRHRAELTERLNDLGRRLHWMREHR